MKMQAFLKKHIGETRKVLFEGKNKNGTMEGYTNHIKITTATERNGKNEIVDWVLW